MTDELKKTDARQEWGYTGLNQTGGYIDEEFVPDLKGDRRHKVYAEMSKNDAIIGAMLFAVDKLIRQVSWTVEAGHEEGGDDVDFLTSCMDGMEDTWSDFISQILAMLVHGYSLFEVVYQIRQDGLFGWKKFGYRSAETITRWEFNDETGEVIAAIQQGPPTYKEVRLPLSKCVNFRTTANKGNPEGLSALRNAYRPWYFKKRLEEIEAIGVERDLAGLPVIYAPQSIFRSDATTQEQAMLTELKLIAQRLRNDRQSSVVIPDIRNEKGDRILTLELLSTGGRRQVDMTSVIQRYNQAIASTMMTDFILLGHEKVGSFALASSKTAIFATALGAWLDSIAQTLNRVEVPRLFKLNGRSDKKLPRFVHGDIEKQELEEISNYVTRLASSGMLFPDPELEKYLRRLGNLPASPQAEG